MVVADIGAGTGYLAKCMAPAVTPGGKVLAVDVQPEMVALLQSAVRQSGLTQIQPLLGAENDFKLPASSVDLAIRVDVYHELAFPYEVLASIVRWTSRTNAPTSRAARPNWTAASVNWRRRTCDATSPAVCGSYSLGASSFRREKLPAGQAKRLPHYPVPAALLGRLAVGEGKQGTGLGAFLLMDALHCVLLAS